MAQLPTTPKSVRAELVEALPFRFAAEEEDRASTSSARTVIFLSCPASPPRRHQCVEDRLHPLVLGDVVDDEVAVELPIGPREAVALGLARDRVHIGGAKLHRRTALVI